MLIIAGVQVPLTPLVEVDGKTGAVLPLQISFSVANEGAIFSVMVWVSEVETAHWFASGVKI